MNVDSPPPPIRYTKGRCTHMWMRDILIFVYQEDCTFQTCKTQEVTCIPLQAHTIHIKPYFSRCADGDCSSFKAESQPGSLSPKPNLSLCTLMNVENAEVAEWAE